MLCEFDRVNLIVNELLGLSKPIDVVFKEQDIQPLLQDVVALMNSQAMMGNGLIQVDIEEEAPPIFCEQSS
ncbi:hypothetical protein [Domibacillus epiphyticus]|nr:hypothetical protein [Domibacillus epiphyticus]